MPEEPFSQVWEEIYAYAKASGIIVTAASGDAGSRGDGTMIKPDFPGSSPSVVSCGGTTLLCPTLEYSDGTTKETAWSLSGGGYSSLLPKPTWQARIDKRDVYRCSPDVCAVGDPETGVMYRIDDKWIVCGGTSVSSPVVASFIAAAEGITSAESLYSAHRLDPKAFNDIIYGGNQDYDTDKGCDPVTGLGSISGAALVAALSKVSYTHEVSPKG